VKDYYKILGIPREAGKASIRKAWHELALKHHPDHNPGDLNAEERFKEAQEAYYVLSDENKKAVYDLTGGISYQTGFTRPPVIRHYFYVMCDSLRAKLNEEIEVTFTYSGEGRVFRRPSFKGFHITGPPFVSTRFVMHEEQRVRETSLTYLVCPLQKGMLFIETATIRINNIQHQTNGFSIEVSDNECYFLEGEIADGKPYKCPLYYENTDIRRPFSVSGRKNDHVLLIPRSKTAFIFHTIGASIKFVSMIWGAVMLQHFFDINMLLGALAGSAFGGLNCQVMYRLMHMKSKFQYTLKYPLVQEYVERGYRLGEHSGIPLLSGQFFYFIGKMLV
jgi:hypothetical protein